MLVDSCMFSEVISKIITTASKVSYVVVDIMIYTADGHLFCIAQQQTNYVRQDQAQNFDYRASFSFYSKPWEDLFRSELSMQLLFLLIHHHILQKIS